MKKYTLIFFVALSCCCVLAVGVIFFKHYSFLPLDLLNQTISPYSHGVDSLRLHNHFLQDAITQYYPYKQMSAQGVGGVFKPVWNPLWFGGYPHYTDTMAGHFDITNVVLWIQPFHTAYHVQILVQLLIAGVGMYLLLVHMRIHAIIAVTVAIGFMLNSLFCSTLLHRWIVAAFCWAPWILLSMKQYTETPSVRHSVLTALFLALGMMAGNFQTALYLVIVVTIVGVFWLYEEKKSIRKNGTHILGVGLCIILGAFALSMIMWIPSIETLWLVKKEGIQASSRMGATLGLKERIFSFAFLTTFFIPQLAGSVRAFDFTKIFQGDLFDYQGFIGFVPAVCAVFGAVYYWKQRTEMRPFIVLIIIGVVLPIFTPLYQFVYYRIFIIVIFSMCILGAMALNDLIMTDHISIEVRRRFFLIVSLLFGTVVLGIMLLNIAGFFFHDKLYAIAFNYLDARKPLGPPTKVAWFLNRINVTFEHFSLTSPTMYLPIISGCIGLWVLYQTSVRRRISAQKAGLVLGVITAGQVLVQAFSWIPVNDMQRYPLYPETAETNVLHYDSTKYRAMTFTGSSAQAHPVFMRNILSIYGIETFDGLASLMPRTALKLAGEGSAFGIYPNPNALPASFLGLYNTKYLLVDSSWKPHDTIAWRLAFAGKEVSIWQNTKSMPRAFMVYRYAVCQSDSLLKSALYDSAFDGRTVYFEQEPIDKITNDSTATTESVQHQHDANNVHDDEADAGMQERDSTMTLPMVTLTDYQNNTVSVNVVTDREGYLFLSDAYYPGWVARINGVETPIMRANYAGRAIYVPTGKHRIEFSFEPQSFRIGLWISSISLILCVVGIVIGNKKRK